MYTRFNTSTEFRPIKLYLVTNGKLHSLDNRKSSLHLDLEESFSIQDVKTNFDTVRHTISVVP